MQRYKFSFDGQNVWLGIDVHLKSWHVTAITASGFQCSFVTRPDAQVLIDTLNKKFPGAHFKAAYEAGFSGFSTYYALTGVGIETIAVNAADIPTTQKEQLTKTDAVDSAKIARALKKDQLTAIYIKKAEYMDETNLIRLRSRFVKDLNRNKVRIKHLLYTQGVKYPERFLLPTSHWSRAFLQWLTDEVKLLSEEKNTLLHLVAEVKSMKDRIRKINREIVLLSRSDKYKDNYELLKSVPGIGITVAMTFLTELDNDLLRFSSEKRFVSYIGLVPTCHDSGDKTVSGEMTQRGHKHLGSMLIEASWKAIAKDTELAACFARYRMTMPSQKAIVKIARKLACKLFAVIKNKTPYVLP